MSLRCLCDDSKSGRFRGEVPCSPRADGAWSEAAFLNRLPQEASQGSDSRCPHFFRHHVFQVSDGLVVRLQDKTRLQQQAEKPPVEGSHAVAEEVGAAARAMETLSRSRTHVRQSWAMWEVQNLGVVGVRPYKKGPIVLLRL